MLVKYFKWMRSLSLTAKLFLLLLPLAAVPPAAVMVQWYVVTQAELTDEAKRGLETRWVVVENEIVSFFQKINFHVHEAERSPLFKDFFGYMEYGLPEEAMNIRSKIEEYLSRLSDKQVVFKRICFSFNDGQNQIKVLEGKSEFSKTSVSGGKCPKLSAMGGMEFNKNIQGPDEEINQKYLRSSIALRNRWREPWGRLTFDIPLSEINSLLARLPLPNEGVGAILDARGQVIVCAQPLHKIQKSDLCKEAIALSKAHRFTISEDAQPITIDSNVVLVRRLSMKDPKWSAALLVTTESFGAIEQKLRNSSLLGGAVFFIAAVFALLPLSRRATGPLRRLEKLTHNF